jgi:hypothetical protein
MTIDHVTVQGAAPEVQRFTWCKSLPEQFMTHTGATIHRLDTDAMARSRNYPVSPWVNAAP